MVEAGIAVVPRRRGGVVGVGGRHSRGGSPRVGSVSGLVYGIGSPSSGTSGARGQPGAGPYAGNSTRAFTRTAASCGQAVTHAGRWPGSVLHKSHTTATSVTPFSM